MDTSFMGNNLGFAIGATWIAISVSIFGPSAFAQDLGDGAAVPDGPVIAAEGAGQDAGLEGEKDFWDTLLAVPVHGFLTTRYRMRATGDTKDHDAYLYLGLDSGDPLGHKITAHLLSRATLDLDGEQDTRGFYAFDSITDSYDSSLNGRIYYGYVDFHRLGFIEKLRLGRQLIYEAPEVAYFDGIRVDTEMLRSYRKLQFGFYGGVPVHLYESSPRGDALLGAYFQARPWTGGRVRLDYLYAQDDTASTTNRDHYYSLGIWQTLSERVNLNARYSRINGVDRDLLLRGTYLDAETDLRVQASVNFLFSTQRDLAIEFDPYFASALEYDPYWQARVSLYKGWTKHFATELGADIRQLMDDEDEGAYNHAFTRSYVTLLWPELTMFKRRLDVDITGEMWDSEQNRDYFSIGTDVDYQIHKKLKASIGTAHSLYKYDYYLNIERDHVQTYYARMRYEAAKNVRFDLSYEFEDDDFQDYHTLKLGGRYKF